MTVRKFAALRIRPDLATKVCPGYPWLNREAYLAWRKMQIERVVAVVVG